ncbi:MAG: LysR family transcriptional regulator [Bdellovibrionales bacterium]
MNFTNLKYFVDTVKQGSVQASAKLNYVSQPAVSQGIKRLETELDIKLLKHKRNSLIVTNEGHSVFKEACELFFHIRTYEQSIDLIKGTRKSQINIGISNSLVANCLANTLKTFNATYPTTEVKIHLGTTKQQIDKMSQNEIDVGITIFNYELEGYQTETVGKGRLLLYHIEGAQKNLLTTASRPETESLLDFLDKKDIKNTFFRRKIQIQSWTTIKELVLSGYGYGLIPDFMISQTEMDNFKIKPKRILPLQYKIVSFWKPGKISDFHKNFISMMK